MIHRPSPAQHGKVFKTGEGWVVGGADDGNDCRCSGSLRKQIRSSCSSRFCRFTTGKVGVYRKASSAGCAVQLDNQWI